MRLHKERTNPIEIDGKAFLEVSCEKCEWKHTMRLNSGLNIGMRLALAKHMEFWESTRKKYARVCPECSKDSGTKPKVADSSRLSSMALLPPQAHAIRRFYKARRIAPTSRDLLKPTTYNNNVVDWQSITKTIRTFLLQTTNGKNQNDKNAINNKKQQIYELLVEDFINNRKQLDDTTLKKLKTKFHDAQPDDDVQVLIANCKEYGKFDEEIIHFIVEYLAYLSKNDVKKLPKRGARPPVSQSPRCLILRI